MTPRHHAADLSSTISNILPDIGALPGFQDFLAAAATRRVVVLGECSHRFREFNIYKGALVRALVEELGYSVLTFEAGMASAAGVFGNHELTPLELCGGLYGFARTREMAELFEWWSRPHIRERVAIEGMDPRVSRPGTEWIERMLREIGYEHSHVVARVDAILAQLGRRGFVASGGWPSETEIGRSGCAAILRDALVWLRENRSGDRARLLLERVLDDRATFLEVILDGDLYFAWRERSMAANLVWIADTLHPAAKIIVWAHNYHTCSRHSEIDGTLTMGELLPQTLRDAALNIGLYAYDGTGEFEAGVPYTIPPPAESTLEHHALGDGEAARITLFGSLEGWWSQPCTARAWGVEEEPMTPSHQYDGVLVVRDVHPVAVIGAAPAVAS